MIKRIKQIEEEIDLRAIPYAEWPEDFRCSAYTLIQLNYRGDYHVLQYILDSYGPLMAREWLSRRIEMSLGSSKFI